MGTRKARIPIQLLQDQGRLHLGVRAKFFIPVQAPDWQLSQDLERVTPKTSISKTKLKGEESAGLKALEISVSGL